MRKSGGIGESLLHAAVRCNEGRMAVFWSFCISKLRAYLDHQAAHKWRRGDAAHVFLSVRSLFNSCKQEFMIGVELKAIFRHLVLMSPDLQIRRTHHSAIPDSVGECFIVSNDLYAFQAV